MLNLAGLKIWIIFLLFFPLICYWLIPILPIYPLPHTWLSQMPQCYDWQRFCPSYPALANFAFSTSSHDVGVTWLRWNSNCLDDLVNAVVLLNSTTHLWNEKYVQRQEKFHVLRETERKREKEIWSVRQGETRMEIDGERDVKCETRRESSMETDGERKRSEVWDERDEWREMNGDQWRVKEIWSVRQKRDE